MKTKNFLLGYLIIVSLANTTLLSCKVSQKAVTTSYSKKSSNYFLFLSDVHLNNFLDAVDPKGNTGRKLWSNCRQKIESILDSVVKPAFILFTGDLPAHYKTHCRSCIIGGDTLKNHNANIRTVLTDLRKLVTKNNIPLLFAPGNNDGIDGDYFSFTDTAGKTPFYLAGDPANPYPALNVPKSDMISDEHIHSGYYAVKLIEGLRLISLNSVIFGQTYYVADNISQFNACDTQMTWLGKQLQNASVAGDKVYISMHIPPGIDAYQYDSFPGSPDTATWKVIPQNILLNKFLSIITLYNSTVAGIFYGHTHMDELRMLHDSLGNAIQVAISCPAISVDHGNNPGFKSVSFDPASKLPLDFTTYYTHPSDSAWGDRTYRFSDLFSTTVVTPVFNRLKPMSNAEITDYIKLIFTVKNGPPSYDITPGIGVNWLK